MRKRYRRKLWRSGSVRRYVEYRNDNNGDNNDGDDDGDDDGDE